MVVKKLHHGRDLFLESKKLPHGCMRIKIAREQLMILISNPSLLYDLSQSLKDHSKTIYGRRVL